MSKIHPCHIPHALTLDSPAALKKELPIKASQSAFVQEARQQITNILQGTDSRLLLIVGPCSIHDIQSAKEYAARLHALAQATTDTFFIVMRTYFEKPRTALGWKGMLYDPHLNGTDDISTGIRLARHLLLELANMGVPTATEFLDPLVFRFFDDLISWGCIGARTSESQIHRQLASSLPMSIAFKNNTSGNVAVAINGILSAMTPHSFLGIDEQGHLSIVRSAGNPLAHLALRGGKGGPNYDPKSIEKALDQLRSHRLPQRLLIDCSHDNSNRCHHKQQEVFESVVEQYLNGNTAIRGLNLESHLFAGSQGMPNDLSRIQYAVSLTDPCMGWEETEALVLRHAALLEHHFAQAALSPQI